jgi:hypothetical protein
MTPVLHDLLHEVRALDTGRRPLRSFGLLVGAVLTGLGALVGWRSAGGVPPLAYVLAGAGAALLLAGLTVPALLRPLYRAWMGLALVLGYVMTRVLLTLVFFLLVVPIGLGMRWTGKDPLQRKWDRKAPTYWIRREHPEESPDRLEKYY